jgi:hypothetical protein
MKLKPYIEYDNSLIDNSFNYIHMSLKRLQTVDEKWIGDWIFSRKVQIIFTGH